MQCNAGESTAACAQRSKLTFKELRGMPRPAGISATTNHGGSDLLYVFITSTEFAAEKSYSRFEAYAELEHGGTSRPLPALGEQGYGNGRRFSEASYSPDAGSWYDPDRSFFDDRRGELPNFPTETFDPAWQSCWSSA